MFAVAPLLILMTEKNSKGKSPLSHHLVVHSATKPRLSNRPDSIRAIPLNPQDLAKTEHRLQIAAQCIHDT